MKKLMTTDDEDSNDNLSFRGNTFRGSEIPLESDRSSHSLYSRPRNSRQNNSLYNKSHSVVMLNNQFAVSDDNPFATNILKYYNSDSKKIKSYQRETSLSTIERKREREAQLQIANKITEELRNSTKFHTNINTDRTIKVPTLNLSNTRNTYKVTAIVEEPPVDHESPVKKRQAHTSHQIYSKSPAGSSKTITPCKATDKSDQKHSNYLKRKKVYDPQEAIQREKSQVKKQVTSLIDNKWKKYPDSENSNTSNIQRPAKTKTRDAKDLYSSKVDTWNKRLSKNTKRREPRVGKLVPKATGYDVVAHNIQISTFEEPYSPDDRINLMAMENLQNRRNKIYYYLQSNPANGDFKPDLGKWKASDVIVHQKSSEECERVMVPVPYKK